MAKKVSILKEVLIREGFEFYSGITSCGKYSASELASDEANSLQKMLVEGKIFGYVAVPNEAIRGYEFYIKGCR